MADEEEIQEQDFVEKKKPKKTNGMIVTLLGLNAVIMLGVAYFQYTIHLAQTNKTTIQDVVKAQMKSTLKEMEEEDTGQAKQEDGILFPLDSFTANLAQGDGPRRYVRLNAVLKFSKDSNEEEFKVRKPQIRDTIISILNSKRPDDLLKVEGKNYLKEEIKAAINTFLVDGQVIDLYYVGFQIN